MQNEYLYNITNQGKSDIEFGNGDFVVSQFGKIAKTVLSTRFSIKCVINGEEEYRINNIKHQLSESQFLIVNENSNEKLDVSIAHKAKGVCIYPPENIVREIYSYHTTDQEYKLDNPVNAPDPIHFIEKTTHFQQNKTGKFLEKQIKNILNLHHQNQIINFDSFYEQLVEFLIEDQLKVNTLLNQLSSVKRQTKEELFRRVSLAREYIEANYHREIKLDWLSEQFFLSKYHFIRSFKNLYQVSPYQYILSLRLKEANNLKNKGYSITEISEIVGFSDVKNLRKALKRLSV